MSLPCSKLFNAFLSHLEQDPQTPHHGQQSPTWPGAGSQSNLPSSSPHLPSPRPAHWAPAALPLCCSSGSPSQLSPWPLLCPLPGSINSRSLRGLFPSFQTPMKYYLLGEFVWAASLKHQPLPSLSIPQLNTFIYFSRSLPLPDITFVACFPCLFVSATKM